VGKSRGQRTENRELGTEISGQQNPTLLIVSIVRRREVILCKIWSGFRYASFGVILASCLQERGWICLSEIPGPRIRTWGTQFQFSAAWGDGVSANIRFLDMALLKTRRARLDSRVFSAVCQRLYG
jgi:hypothetical protein